MKKALILAVVLMLVVASIAAAGIRFSKHDLSSSSTNSTVRSNNTDDLCVFCHTPHASNTAMTAAPLWNRSNSQSGWTNTNAYSSTTLNGTASTPTNANAISLACLGCHDGNVAGETLVNGPGSGTTSNVTWSASQFVSVANLNDASGLQNDHPIGVAMPNAADPGLYATIQNTNVTAPGGRVECSSCHDVHTPGAANVFLSMSNAGSAMCLACHNK